MKIRKSDLIAIYAQSIGVDTAKVLITKNINAAALEDKENYTEEEIARICSELAKEKGVIRIVAQAFLVQSERKKSEELTLLLDNIETQIWYLTDRETYGAVNKAHADFLGMGKRKFDGKSLYDVVGRKEAEVFIASNRKVFEQKKQIHTEEWIKNVKGEARLLSLTRTPKLDDNGEVEYVICAAEDITERKQAEEELKHLTISLQEHVKKLEESKRKITEAYRLRENFLKETTHRIFTPIAIIGGYAELLLESRDLNDDQREIIRTMQEKNEEIQELVRDTLAGKY
jgi:PAS domain S-box-containing protein